MGGKKSGRIRNVREEDRKDLCFPPCVFGLGGWRSVRIENKYKIYVI